MKKLVWIFTAVIILSACQISMATIVISNQGFEADAADWTNYGGTVTRVATGTNGVTSAAGSYHAELALDGSGVYTFGAEKNRELPWPGFGTFYQTIDLYLDPAAGNIGDTFDVYAAIKGVNANGYISNEGFNVEKTAAGEWQIKAINDSVANALSVTSAQWLTLESNWNEEAGGMARDSYIYDAGGTQVYMLDRPTKGLLTTETYQTGYIWIKPTSGTPTVAVDNAVYVVPEPATMVLLGLGGLLIRKRK